MMKKSNVFVVLLSAVVMTLIFHKQAFGLNLFVFEGLLLVWFFFAKQYNFKSLNQIVSVLGLLTTSIFTIVTHSVFSYAINFLALMVFIGMLNYPEAKSLVTYFGLSFTSFFNNQAQFFKQISQSSIRTKKLFDFLKKSRIFLIPLIIIVVFVVIYQKSNPIFNDLSINIGVFIQDVFNSIFANIDFWIVLTFSICFLLSNYFFFRSPELGIINRDKLSNEALIRKRKRYFKPFRFNILLDEYKAAVFLLIVLNAILLVLNVIDVNWVWFNFHWEGQYLKQFVHEGTYLLIVSILISIFIVLYFFRSNLNFYSRNKFLKYLSYIWLAQNAVLAISVAVRNFYYISYFALAYKRIGVIIFLILTIYGLFTVLVKVKNKKSPFYLFKTNAFALYVVLVISSGVNWDKVIAKYNFQHAETSFLHLDYMMTLSDKSLPYLDVPLEELIRLDKIQKEKFPFEQKYLTPESYHVEIERRKVKFAEEWESKSILSWNLPEYLAYKSFAK